MEKKKQQKSIETLKEHKKQQMDQSFEKRKHKRNKVDFFNVGYDFTTKSTNNNLLPSNLDKTQKSKALHQMDKWLDVSLRK